MPTDKPKETKAEFNARYGAWLREIRIQEFDMSVDALAAATGIDAKTIIAAEAGQVIEMYDALQLCEYFGVED